MRLMCVPRRSAGSVTVTSNVAMPLVVCDPVVEEDRVAQTRDADLIQLDAAIVDLVLDVRQLHAHSPR